jgi:hypothetical protein
MHAAKAAIKKTDLGGTITQHCPTHSQHRFYATQFPPPAIVAIIAVCVTPGIADMPGIFGGNSALMHVKSAHQD